MRSMMRRTAGLLSAALLGCALAVNATPGVPDTISSTFQGTQHGNAGRHENFAVDTTTVFDLSEGALPVTLSGIVDASNFAGNSILAVGLISVDRYNTWAKSGRSPGDRTGLASPNGNLFGFFETAYAAFRRGDEPVVNVGMAQRTSFGETIATFADNPGTLVDDWSGTFSSSGMVMTLNGTPQSELGYVDVVDFLGWLAAEPRLASTNVNYPVETDWTSGAYAFVTSFHNETNSVDFDIVFAQGPAVVNVTRGLIYEEIQAAITEADPGDLIEVRIPGTYDPIDIDRPLTLTATVDGVRIVGSRPNVGVVQFTDGTSDVVFENFRVEAVGGNPSQNNFGIYLRGNHSNLQIRNNVVNAAGPALEASNGVNGLLSVEESEFSGNEFNSRIRAFFLNAPGGNNTIVGNVFDVSGNLAFALETTGDRVEGNTFVVSEEDGAGFAGIGLSGVPEYLRCNVIDVPNGVPGLMGDVSGDRIDARFNFWGGPLGPLDTFSNAAPGYNNVGGDGAALGGGHPGNIRYWPWLASVGELQSPAQLLLEGSCNLDAIQELTTALIPITPAIVDGDAGIVGNPGRNTIWTDGVAPIAIEFDRTPTSVIQRFYNENAAESGTAVTLAAQRVVNDASTTQAGEPRKSRVEGDFTAPPEAEAFNASYTVIKSGTGTASVNVSPSSGSVQIAGGNAVPVEFTIQVTNRRLARRLKIESVTRNGNPLAVQPACVGEDADGATCTVNVVQDATVINVTFD
jgi:hypothetical protein